MPHSPNRPPCEVLPSIRLVSAWQRYGKAVSVLGVVYFVIAAAGKLAYAFPHLVRDVASWSAVDMKYRHAHGPSTSSTGT